MELNEYQQNLDKFYKLKQKYNNKLLRDKQKLLSDDTLSRKEKRLKFNQIVQVCINCKNKGGTIFENNKDYFRVTCGNINSPCDININFKRQKIDMINYLIIKYMELLSDLKEKIIKIKLNYILDFISEEESIIEFNAIKKKLSYNNDIYRELLESYFKITNNIHNQEEIDKKTILKNDIIFKIKNHVEKYNFNKNSLEITEIIEIYTQDLINILNDLRKLQYKYCYVHSENNKHLLFKENYSLKDLEIGKK